MKTSFVVGFLVLVCASAEAQDPFPKIAPAVQAARDDDRLTILREERQTEQKALQAAEKALASAGPDADMKSLSESMQRHVKNLAALDAEIGRMGGKGVGSDRNMPVRLKAASAAPATVAAPAESVPYWDVYRREQKWRTK